MTRAGRGILVVGAGNMGGAIVKALTRSRVPRLSFYEIDRAKARALQRETGVAPAPHLAQALPRSETVILAVKPQGLSAFLDQAASLFRPRQLLITILAGVPARVLRKRIRARIRIVRAMPNTPALVGAGITAMAGRSRRDLAAAAAVFSKLGRVVVVREAMMNAVTAVSGAGPAYVYRFTEALAEAGRRQGFSAGLARTLAEETLKGAAALLAATGEMSGVLRARVTSPGGVTEAALKKMAALGFEKTLIRGVAAGVRRGRELSP